MRILAILLLLTLSLLSHAQSAPLTGRVTVIDGDTVEMDNGTRIRLWGVDAPELSQTCENRHGETVPCGLWAAHQLERHFASGVWQCQHKGEHGRRVVAHCFVNGRDINEHLAREGWAVATPRFTNRFVRASEMAQHQRRGIWEGRFETPHRYRQQRGR